MPRLTIFSCAGGDRRCCELKSSNAEARALLEHAIAISPDFAAAYAYIAFTHLNDWVITGDAAERHLETSLKIATRAVAIDDEDPYGHFVF